MYNRLIFLLFITGSTIQTQYAPYPPYHPSKPHITPQLYQIIKDFHEILTENKVPYWISDGTLLGAVRNKEIIPWDDDLDVGIHENDLDQFINLKEAFERRNYDFSLCPKYTVAGRPTFFKISSRKGIPINDSWFYRYPWLDVMVYADDEDRIRYHPQGAFGVLWKHAYYLRDELFPLKMYKLGNLSVVGPNNPIPFLNRLYPKWQTTYLFYAHKENNFKKVQLNFFCIENQLQEYTKIYSQASLAYIDSIIQATRSTESQKIYEINSTISRNDSEIEITINTTDALAAIYEQTHNNINTVKHHLDFMIDYLKNWLALENEKKVLDVGCGPGRDIQYFLQNGLNATGIDLSQKTLEIAQAKVPDAQFFVMDMSETIFPDECFHGLWCCGSFYHLPKRLADKAIEEFYRIIKKNGILYLAIKEGDGEKLIFKEEYLQLPKFYSFYTVGEIESLLKKHNFIIQKIILEKKIDNWINIFAIKA
jgi:phosphorylcholine metabolism protein LicD/ubiquinone/menaquinone biosynthesis C-methylase UbiE